TCSRSWASARRSSNASATPVRSTAPSRRRRRTSWPPGPTTRMTGSASSSSAPSTRRPPSRRSSWRTAPLPRPRVVRVGRRRREDEVLYLLKGSRVREYHQQNVAILGAPEGEVIEVAYNRRWVQEGLSLEPGTDCAIVFGDSPYEYFVPIRFAALLRAEETDSRVTVVCKLGPFVRRGALGPLNERWNRPDRPLRPGDVFLFEDRNPGLVSPRGLAETEDAWRAAVDALRHNDFYERTSVARLHSVIDEGGR